MLNYYGLNNVNKHEPKKDNEYQMCTTLTPHDSNTNNCGAFSHIPCIAAKPRHPKCEGDQIEANVPESIMPEFTNKLRVRCFPCRVSTHPQNKLPEVVSDRSELQATASYECASYEWLVCQLGAVVLG